MPKDRARKLPIKTGDKFGNWVVVAGPTWRGDGSYPNVVVTCLLCSKDYERIAYQFVNKQSKHLGCESCVRRLRRSGTVNGQKRCKKCGEWKDLLNFHSDKSRYDGKYPWCATCINTYTLRIKSKHRHRRTERYMTTSRRWRDKKYFGSATIFDELITKQGGKCATCARIYYPHDVPRFVIDHCHETKIIRGVLCPACNKSLGYARDNPETLMRLAEYIKTNAGIPIIGGEYGKG